MSPFTPKGLRAFRVIVAEMAAQRDYGDVITYDELGAALDLDAAVEVDKAKIRQAVSSARPLLLTGHQRTLTPQRGKGYRVALPGEYAGIAQDHRSRADRQVSKALAVIDHAPTGRMTAEELTRHRAVSVVIHNMHARITSAEQRLADLEEVVYGGKRPPVIQGQLESEP